MVFEQSSKVVEEFINETQEYLKKSKLSDLPEYSKLRDKDILGKIYTNDIQYYERLTEFKSTFYGLIAYYTKEHLNANREEKRKIDNMIDYLTNKSKEIDTKLEAAKNRLSFYKTITYMIGNVLYGAN